MIFSGFDYSVQLYDVDAECLAKAPKIIAKELAYLCKSGLARGKLTLEQRLARISTSDSLEECLRDAYHIQECIYDSLTLKQELFERIDSILDHDQDVAICSTTSVHLPSLIFGQVKKHRSKCLVAHAVNPPLHIRLVELIPMSCTSEELLIRARLTMVEIGQKPVVILKEVPGFALNRLKYALLQEAFRLVHDGIMTADDVDTVVSDGLGPRYAFMGPWMTAHLNAAGMADYLNKYSEGIYNVNKDCQPLLRLEGEAAQQVVDTMIHEVPIDKLDEKRAWRDRCLIELTRIKETLGD